MPGEFSTGSHELDNVLEELRAGDNVVFYTRDQEDYLPFVSSVLGHLQESPSDLVYVRTTGLMDAMVADVPGVQVLDLASLAGAGDFLLTLEAEMHAIGPRVQYLLEPLSTLGPWIGDETHLRRFFLTTCPLLRQMETVVYWSLLKGAFSPATVATIKDCTQLFLQVDHLDGNLVITPVKVWGRYSEAMFRPHRVSVDSTGLHVHPLPIGVGDPQVYTQALEEKNRELAQVRDALDHSNRELQERNVELAELNERVLEQSRLYQSLRVNLDHLLALFQAGQAIGSSLVVDQVRRAALTAALRLFEASASRLHLNRVDETRRVDIFEGAASEWIGGLAQEPAAKLRKHVKEALEAGSLPLRRATGEVFGSIAMAPITARGQCLGTLEVCAFGTRLDTSESRTLLSYLASEASIALDNAHLYREVEVQGRQLRSFVEDIITHEELDSRRFAFDLHDALVQLIVASYQHLQTAQAWRGRDPGNEEKEIEEGVQLLRRSIYEARRLISQLRPAGLDDFGLVHALRIHAAQLATEADWQVSLDVDPNWTELPPALETALFRIVQEATTNARKYADTPRVEIRLAATADALCVSVRDWGKGFALADVSVVPHKGMHMGLIGIRERARLWGGECNIESQAGEGTRIEVRIPRSRLVGTEESAV